MVSINLYQSKANQQTIDFPTEWNEISTPCLEIIATELLADHKNVYELKAAILVKMLAQISGNKDIAISLDAEDAYINGMPLLDFIWKENTLTKQPYPYLIAHKKLKGATDHFDTLQVAEYEDAFIHYMNFKADDQLIHLANIAAILYRPAGTAYIHYNANRDLNIPYPYEDSVPYFLKLSPAQLYVIFMWFTGCQDMLQKIFWNVYSGSGTSTEPDLLSFTKCIHAAAGPKNGTRDMIRRQNLKELLFDMEQEAIKAKEMEEHYANTTK